MPIYEEPKPSLAHRLDRWVHENKTFLLFLLLGGVCFFGLLGGITLWKQGRESNAKVELLELAGRAAEALKGQQWETCISRYESLYKKADHPFFRVLALHGKGSCLRGKKDYKEAVEVFERAAKEPGHIDPLVSLFEMARTYQLEGRPEALEKFQGLLKKEKLSSSLKTEIEKQIEWIQSQKKS